MEERSKTINQRVIDLGVKISEVVTGNTYEDILMASLGIALLAGKSMGVEKKTIDGMIEAWYVSNVPFGGRVKRKR